MKEEIQLQDVQFSFTHSPKLNHLNATGLIWLLDNLQLVRPIVYIYLKQRFLFPKCAIFKFQTPFRNLVRRPTIGCPTALFCIDIIQAENIPLIKNRKTRTTDKANKDKLKNDKFSTKSKPNDELSNITSDLSKSKRCKFLKCFNYELASVFCKVKIFNQQFVSPQISNLTNPLWNFRSFVPIFSHNKHSIEQLEKYHGLFNLNDQQENPIDLNASFYQFPSTQYNTKNSSPSKTAEIMTKIKKFISYEFLENLSVTIQLFDKQDDQNKLIAEFQISDPSQYFLDPESNGQSIWINSLSTGVLAMNVDQSIKLNVRFTFLTLNHTFNSIILSNAYLANRLAFPMGVMLVFIDSAIGLNIESLKSNLNPKSEYGFQIVCQLGNQILYTSICTDLSFIWENELLFCVYSLNLEKITVKLVARSLKSSNYDITTIATNKLDLSGLLYQPTLTFQQYCPLVLKNDSFVQLKLLFTFRIIHFTTKLVSNCLRNAKVAEEDLLTKEKQYFIEEKLKTGLKTKQITVPEESPFENTFIAKKIKPIEDEELVHSEQIELNEEKDGQSITSTEPPVTEVEPKAIENINIVIFVRMRWPKVNRFVIEIVDLKCAKFLAIFQIYSIDVYLNCVLREKEKAIQSKKTKNFKLKSTTVSINQVLVFNCITKPLSAYHLNISLHEKRTEEYSKIAELYTSLPSLILASGQIDKQLVLNLTPMYLKTSGCFNETFSPDYIDQFEVTNTKHGNEPVS